MDQLGELYFRRRLCDAIIRMISEMEDPRKEDALKEYRGQRAQIDGKITDLEKAERQRLGLPEPEPVIVGLKSAVLFGKAQS